MYRRTYQYKCLKCLKNRLTRTYATFLEKICGVCKKKEIEAVMQRDQLSLFN